MHASALPLVPAFQALLLGQVARRARPHVPPKVLRAKSLSQLRAVFGWLIPDARWQGPPRGAPNRERLFTPLITFWAFLSQVLSADSACRTAVRKVQAGWVRQGGSADVGQYQRLLPGARPLARGDARNPPGPTGSGAGK